MSTQPFNISDIVEHDQHAAHEENGHVHGPNCSHHHHAPLSPITRQTPKLGRNDICSRGSQKKYKKCCGK